MVFIYLPILFLSIVLHEIAHGYSAYRLGDDTAYYAGRLTLNPLSHIDPFGTILIPAMCYLTGLPIFGWAKPVPVNVMRLKNPHRDMGKVALSGPLTNLTIALFCVIVLKAATVFAPELIGKAFVMAMQYAILINILLALFNLLPILPLDGGRVLNSVLPAKLAYKFSATERYGMYIAIAFIALGGVRYVVWPLADFVYKIFITIFFGS